MVDLVFFIVYFVSWVISGSSWLVLLLFPGGRGQFGGKVLSPAFLLGRRADDAAGTMFYVFAHGQCV
jgi:hypothetical protein